jgi:hypothetical protein
MPAITVAKGFDTSAASLMRAPFPTRTACDKHAPGVCDRDNQGPHRVLSRSGAHRMTFVGVLRGFLALLVVYCILRQQRAPEQRGPGLT